jgi:hypothetical protein
VVMRQHTFIRFDVVLCGEACRKIRGLQVLWITQVSQGILDVVRFPHLLT